MRRSMTAAAAACLLAALAFGATICHAAQDAPRKPPNKGGLWTQGSGEGAGLPDYSEWARMLRVYYDPAHGMDYRALKVKESVALDKLRRRLAEIDVARLPKPDQLAYWINLYNISVVDTV